MNRLNQPSRQNRTLAWCPGSAVHPSPPSPGHPWPGRYRATSRDPNQAWHPRTTTQTGRTPGIRRPRDPPVPSRGTPPGSPGPDPPRSGPHRDPRRNRSRHRRHHTAPQSRRSAPDPTGEHCATSPRALTADALPPPPSPPG